MGAAVDEGIDSAVRPARHNNRDLADRCRDPIAGLGDLAGETQVIPGRPLEDAFLLNPVLLRVGVEAEWDLADPVRRPCNGTIEPGILHGHGRSFLAEANGRPLLCARAAHGVQTGQRRDYAGTASSSRVCAPPVV